MAIGTTITFGTLTLAGTGQTNTIQNTSRNKRPGTKKIIYNESYNETQIPGRSREWIIRIRGRFVGTNKDTDRATLEGYDDGELRRYNDGHINIDMIILPGTLVIEDTAPPKDMYEYSMTLVEYNQ